MKTLRQSSRSSLEMGASDTRLLTPNTTVRRISLRTLKPVGSSTNQVLSISGGTDFTCSREYTPRRANAMAFSSASVPKIFTSWFWKAGPIASASRMAMENASSPVADPLEDLLDNIRGIGRPAAAAVRGHFARLLPPSVEAGVTRPDVSLVGGGRSVGANRHAAVAGVATVVQVARDVHPADVALHGLGTDEDLERNPAARLQRNAAIPRLAGLGVERDDRGGLLGRDRHRALLVSRGLELRLRSGQTALDDAGIVVCLVQVGGIGRNHAAVADRAAVRQGARA